MLDLAPPFRRATPEDDRALAEFVNMAGEGLPLHLWGGMATAEQDAWDVGRARARREQGSFSYRNAIMAEDEGAIAACLIGYALPEAPEPIDTSTMPPLFVPMQELENLAPATWYVNVLATHPQFRRRGYGTELLQLADAIAAEAQLSGLSIIVNDANQRARRLYASAGYREIARRPMVKDGWSNAGSEWVLLVKELQPDGVRGQRASGVPA